MLKFTIPLSHLNYLRVSLSLTQFKIFYISSSLFEVLLESELGEELRLHLQPKNFKHSHSVLKIFTGKRMGCVVALLCLVWPRLDLQAAANPHPTTRWRPRVSQEALQAQEMPRNTLHARAGQLVQGQLEDAPRKRRHLKRSFMFVWNFFYWKMVCEYLLSLQIPEHDIIYI